MSPLFSRFVKTIALPLVMLALLLPASASADKIDRLIGQLSSSDDYKVRLSAALSLSKLRSQRAVPAFIKALGDSDKTVRGVSAASLRKVVTGSTKKSLRNKALTALKSAAAKDKSSFVRRQAQKAYDAISEIGSGASVTRGGTYVNIGAMSADVANSSSMRQLMKKTAQKTFKKKASSMMISFPGSDNPSKRDLDSNNIMAFHVDGTLNELSAKTSGSSTTVSCKVSMLLATYPEKSMFGFLKGGAQVQAGASTKDIDFAKEDCVAAVIEDLIARKIIPTIESRR